jgi:hypothetical protein
VKSTSIFEYTLDTLSRSTTYKDNVTTAPTSSHIKKSVTLYFGNEGEEKAERTFNYNFLGTTVKTTTIFTYTLDTLTKSVTYRGNITGATTASDVKRSETLYKGPESEEKADRTFNYNYEGTQIKSTSIFEYTLDTLSRSTTYKGNVTASPLAADIKKSVTVYTGNEGEEKAERTFNYNFLGTVVKSTTIFQYQNDTLTQSTTYKDNVTATPTASNIKKSVTLYTGNEGEEKLVGSKD